MTAAKEVAALRAQGFTQAGYVKTSPDTDAELNKDAMSLNQNPWYYVFLLRDCGTFANAWLDFAGKLQSELHPLPFFPITPGPIIY